MQHKQALLVIDYQNDFAHPNGSLYVKGGEQKKDYINATMKDFKEKSEILISSQDWHPKSHSSFASVHKISPFSSYDNQTKWPDHCIQDTWGAAFFEGLNTHMIEKKILKGTSQNIDAYSAFGGREKDTGDSLDTILKTYGIQILSIVGLATEYCVFSTVQDAIKLGYKVNVLTQGIAAVDVNPFDGDNAIQEMKRIGASVVE